MTNLREAVSTALCRTYFAHDYEGEELERIVDNERMDWLDEADAAIAVAFQALKKPSEAMVLAGERAAWDENASMPMPSYMAHGYAAMIQTFTRDHYLSALAEEDGKEL